MNLEKAIAEIEWLERLYLLLTAGHQTAPVVRPLRRKPKARRDVRAQSVVPAVEAVRGLIHPTYLTSLLDAFSAALKSAKPFDLYAVARAVEWSPRTLSPRKDSRRLRGEKRPGTGLICLRTANQRRVALCDGIRPNR